MQPQTHHDPAPATAGLLTFRSKVNRWECDQNNHWNVRFYVRAFQIASETIAAVEDGATPGAATVAARHFRFHRELFVTSPVSIHSAIIASGPWAGNVVHRMDSRGRLSATALDTPPRQPSDLPQVAPQDVELALPRGVAAEAHRPTLRTGRFSQLGAVHPSEVDHTGALLPEFVMARVTAASNGFLADLGLTPDFTRATGISRMAVELKMTRHGNCAAGDILRSRSWVSAVARSSIAVRYQLERLASGTAVASVEHRLVFIDLGTRRAVPIPGPILKAVQAATAAET